MDNYRIVIGIDFTDCSIHAARYALSFIKNYKLQVLLVFCLPPLVDITEEIVAPSHRQKVLDDCLLRLNEIKDDLSSLLPNDSTIEGTVKYGYPDDVLINEAQLFNANLLVVGLIQANADSNIIGNKTIDIIKKSKIPVFAIPQYAEIKSSGIANMAYLTNFSSADFASLHRLIEVIPSESSSVYCVHYSRSNITEKDENELNKLRSYCTQTYRNLNITCDIVAGKHQIEDLRAYSHKNEIEMFAVTRQQQNSFLEWFHPTISHQMLANAKIPFMLFCD